MKRQEWNHQTVQAASKVFKKKSIKLKWTISLFSPTQIDNKELNILSCHEDMVMHIPLPMLFYMEF